jgi:hypothetical protein
MKTIWIVPIEPIDQRYTAQWYTNIPKIIHKRIRDLKLAAHAVRTVDGKQPSSSTTSGAFLDFAVTNVYKASQAQRIAEAFHSGEVKAGDVFLVTDAWNFVITPIKYMSDLLNIPVEIHGIWHAGAYDPTDILGYQMQKPWPWHAEQSWFHACDYNYYATDFHRNMFLRNLNIDAEVYGHKAVRSGQPHDPLIAELSMNFDNAERNGAVMWPHRYNSDKQPDIAEDLAQLMPVTITQKMNLNKQAYYKAMSQHSVIFSCALHENLGISVMEAVLSGVIPVLPSRCSYSEMYLPDFVYPSEWTASWDQYQLHRHDLMAFIQERIDNRERYLPALAEQRDILVNNYLTATVMVDHILKVN